SNLPAGIRVNAIINSYPADIFSSAKCGDCMKATVIVTLKPTVLDPQGMTIQRSLGSLGLTDVTDVRQGKIFDIRLKDGSREQVERLAKEVLTNPVIEEYRIIWEQINP